MAEQKKQLHPPKIAIYARKSKATETGKSIENQIAKCTQYAIAKLNAQEEDLLIYQDYGLSGFYEDRPAYQKMLRDIQFGKISAVLCYKMDRISRKTLDLLNFIENLKQKNIAFISCTDDIDTQSKTGKIMISLLASIAEFERDIITERITDNLYELAKEGRWLGGTTPTGFHSISRHTVYNGKKLVSHHLEVIPQEVETIRQIFSVFLQTCSLTQTAEYLKNQGIRSKNKELYHPKTIKNILQNPVYAAADSNIRHYFAEKGIPIYSPKEKFTGEHGLLAYNKTWQKKQPNRQKPGTYLKQVKPKEPAAWIITVGEHPGIIPGNQWIAAQTILNANKNKYHRPKEQSKAMLAGKVICPICQGATYVRSQSNRYTETGNLKYSYICKQKYLTHANCPESPNIPGNDLDKVVFLALFSAATQNKQAMKKQCLEQIEKFRKNNLSDHGHNTKEADIAAQIALLEKGIQQQITNLRTAPEAIKPLFMQDIEQMEQEKQQWQQQWESLQQKKKEKQQQLTIASLQKQILTFLSTPEIFWQHFYLQQNARLLDFAHQIIDTVAVDTSRQILYITCKMPNC